MKSTLSATHLLRHYLLFAFTALFLLTMVRAAYVVWQFPLALETGSIPAIFWMGLRYDLALIGMLLFLPIVIGCLLGMFGFGRGLAKMLVILVLMLSMLFILISEFISPYFMVEQSIRPDFNMLMSLENPAVVVSSLWGKYMIPAIIGLVLVLLITYAYWSRLETNRLLRFRLSRFSAIPLLLIGVLVVAVAIYSGVDPSKPALSPSTGLISAEGVINEIALNTGYKSLYSLALPWLN